MSTEAKYDPNGNDSLEPEKKVYREIAQYLDIEGYLTKGSPDFNAVNISGSHYKSNTSSSKRREGRNVHEGRKR